MKQPHNKRESTHTVRATYNSKKNWTYKSVDKQTKQILHTCKASQTTIRNEQKKKNITESLSDLFSSDSMTKITKNS